MKLSLFNLFMFWNIGLIVAATSFLIVGLQRPTRQYTAPEGQISFRKPIILRTAIVMLSLFFASGPEMLIGQPHKPMSAAVWVGFALITAVCLSFAIICLRFSGPDDLVLNVENHTYRRTTGWPVFPATFSGGWKDMHELCLWEGGGSRTIYIVSIAWVSQQGATQLGRFYHKPSADQFADEMSKILCLKRVNSRPM
ncbi:MAG: hypothetical protein ACRYFS_16730 [Janthinobacterium lividum]